MNQSNLCELFVADGMDTDSDDDDTAVPLRCHMTQPRGIVGNPSHNESGSSNQRDILLHSSCQPTERQTDCPISHKDSQQLDLSFKYNCTYSANPYLSLSVIFSVSLRK